MIENQAIARHKTAISRTNFSKPIRIAFESGLISTSTSVLDYGCGRGIDIKLLQKQGIACYGWDPIYRPRGKRCEADIVNLGYVLNVIEDPKERTQVLVDSWLHARKVLIVAVRHEIEKKNVCMSGFSDGYLTQKGTFQKFYSQNELRDYIDISLGVVSIAGAPGIFFVFRDEGLQHAFIASRYRRRASVPRRRQSDVLFEKYKDILEPLIDFIVERGRLPEHYELSEAQEISDQFGSLKRAYRVVLRVTGDEQWERITKERVQDLLVYIALQKFGGRPKLHQLPIEIQLDVRSFFSTYKNACSKADDLLFSIGAIKTLTSEMRRSSIGKLTPTALYCHESSLELLPPALRIYEGCARAYIGKVDGANVIKLHKDKHKISYLCYPDFDTNPHPALLDCLTVNLNSLKVRYFNYSLSENPSILHRKEQFISKEHPLYEKFSRLTRQEERYNLFENPEVIGKRDTWEQVLEARGVRLVGHRLVRKR